MISADRIKEMFNIDGTVVDQDGTTIGGIGQVYLHDLRRQNVVRSGEAKVASDMSRSSRWAA